MSVAPGNHEVVDGATVSTLTYLMVFCGGILKRAIRPYLVLQRNRETSTREWLRVSQQVWHWRMTARHFSTDFTYLGDDERTAPMLSGQIEMSFLVAAWTSDPREYSRRAQ